MSDDEERTQVSRAVTAKYAQPPSDRLDSGAVALGLLVAVVAFAPIAVLSLPALVGLGLLWVGVAMGGFVAARTSTISDGCGALHGVVTGVGCLFVVSIVTTVTVMTNNSAATTPAAAMGADPLVLGSSGIVVLCLATVGGAIGGREPSAARR